MSDESKGFTLSDNGLKLGLALVGLLTLAVQLWTARAASDAGTKAEAAVEQSARNGADLRRVRGEVREGRNDHRRTMGLAPIEDKGE